MADGYGGYDQLFVPDGATEVACWAHARRMFVDAEAADPKLARQALDLIGVLYGIERDLKQAAKAQGREPTAGEVLARGVSAACRSSKRSARGSS